MMNIEIIKGDCLEVMKHFTNGQFALCLTDPPYGIDYQSAWRTDKTQWKPKIANDTEPFIDWIPEAYRVLNPTGRLFCFYRWDKQEAFFNAINNAGFNIKSQIIWDKVIHGMGDLRGEYAPQHESIIYATKGRYEFTGKRPTSIIQCQRVMPEALLHPNEKPVSLLRKLIRQTTDVGDWVLDCFGGSFATLIACDIENRNCISIEIDETYCEVGKKRIEAEKAKNGLFNGVVC